MVQFSLATPLGIPVQPSDFDLSHRALERVGGLKDVNRPAVRQVIDSLVRDAALQGSSGRWNPGRPDPDQFVPGDIARSVRSPPTASSGGVGAISLQRTRALHLRASPSGDLDLVSDREGLMVALDPDRLLEQPIAAWLLVDLHRAVPYFIPTTAAAAVLAKRFRFVARMTVGRSRSSAFSTGGSSSASTRRGWSRTRAVSSPGLRAGLCSGWMRPSRAFDGDRPHRLFAWSRGWLFSVGGFRVQCLG
jgi:hypothetical protein